MKNKNIIFSLLVTSIIFGNVLEAKRGYYYDNGGGAAAGLFAAGLIGSIAAAAAADDYYYYDPGYSYRSYADENRALRNEIEYQRQKNRDLKKRISKLEEKVDQLEKNRRRR